MLATGYALLLLLLYLAKICVIFSAKCTIIDPPFRFLPRVRVRREKEGSVHPLARSLSLSYKAAGRGKLAGANSDRGNGTSTKTFSATEP